MKSREQSLFAGLLQKQNRTQLAIILGVAAMLLILFSELFSAPAKPAANADSPAAVSETAYREQLETQLTELIEQLDGAGKTVVMVTLESGEETIYAVDTQSGQMQNQETHVLLEDAPPWKRRPICLPSAVWLLSVMVGRCPGRRPHHRACPGIAGSFGQSNLCGTAQRITHHVI